MLPIISSELGINLLACSYSPWLDGLIQLAPDVVHGICSTVTGRMGDNRT